MMVSTKGRYALRIMADLAENQEGGPVSLKDIAERENISIKYLEIIVSSLNKNGLLKSVRGKNGGYMLNREPKDIQLLQFSMRQRVALLPLRALVTATAKMHQAVKLTFFGRNLMT